MKTIYYTALSLDGFIADDRHGLEWLLQFGSVADSSYQAFIAEVGALAMGSNTYEWVQRHLAVSAEPWPYTQPAWVFTSRSLPTIPGADVRFVRGDVRAVHRSMAEAAGGKNLWLVGGGDLVGQFHDSGLLDEIIACIAPVTLGSGKPLLPRRIASPPMRQLEVTSVGESFTIVRYATQR